MTLYYAVIHQSHLLLGPYRRFVRRGQQARVVIGFSFFYGYCISDQLVDLYVIAL
jgi:hypothetical protein